MYDPICIGNHMNLSAIWEIIARVIYYRKRLITAPFGIGQYHCRSNYSAKVQSDTKTGALSNLIF